MEGAEYNRHSRARVAERKRGVETCNANAKPDAPEWIDHRRRCTRHDHRTCCADRAGARPYRAARCEKRGDMCHYTRVGVLIDPTDPSPSAWRRTSPNAGANEGSVATLVA